MISYSRVSFKFSKLYIRAQKSSAKTNFPVGAVFLLIRVFMYWMNKLGERIPPWDAPLLIFVRLDSRLIAILVEL